MTKIAVLILTLLIVILQIYSNGSVIYTNLFHYQNTDAIKGMQVLNLIVGLISLIVLLYFWISGQYDFSNQKLYKVALIILVINVLLMLLHIGLFLGGFGGSFWK